MKKKYRVELEFVIDSFGDEELSQEEMEKEADYAIERGLDKYENIVCDVIGFPGYMDKISVKKLSE